MIAVDGHTFSKNYFAAFWDSVDFAVQKDCSSAIKPEVEFWPIFFPAIAVEALSVVVTALMVGVIQRLLVAAFGSIAP